MVAGLSQAPYGADSVNATICGAAPLGPDGIAWGSAPVNAAVSGTTAVRTEGDTSDSVPSRVRVVKAGTNETLEGPLARRSRPSASTVALMWEGVFKWIGWGLMGAAVFLLAAVSFSLRYFTPAVGPYEAARQPGLAREATSAYRLPIWTSSGVLFVLSLGSLAASQAAARRRKTMLRMKGADKSVEGTRG